MFQVTSQEALKANKTKEDAVTKQYSLRKRRISSYRLLDGEYQKYQNDLNEAIKRSANLSTRQYTQTPILERQVPLIPNFESDAAECIYSPYKRLSKYFSNILHHRHHLTTVKIT